MWRFLFSPYGRVSRKGIWLFTGVYILVLIGTTVIDMITGLYDADAELGLFSGLTALFFFLPSIAIPIKRFHDRNMTGWWYLILSILMIVAAIAGGILGMLISGADLNSLEDMSEAQMMIAFWPGMVGFLAIGIYWFVVQMVLSGTPGANKYGPDPLEKN